MEVTRKPLLFVGTSHDDLKAFPDEARRDAGFNLDFVQRGLEPQNWQPMKTVGPGVKEIRVRDATGAYRVIYLATRPEAVYVLHCFQKKAHKDSQDGCRTGFTPLSSNRGLGIMRKRNIQHATPANRSVFYDLGFDAAEARVLAMRADLMAALREHIKGRGWTQSKAAKELGITQPRVSALMKGAWRDFSADMLLVLASRVGLNPTLKLAA